jgi:hypothetical protein
MFKMDLAGAFTLISFNPDDVHLMGSELTEDKVIFFLCGVFGWSVTPAAFQVVTRACLQELTKLVLGRVCMYVDDVIGICLLWNLDRNFEVCGRFLKGLLGPEAIAVETQGDRWSRLVTSLTWGSRWRSPGWGSQGPTWLSP